MFNIDKANKEKEKFQEEVEVRSQECANLVVEAPTGVGKTLALCRCIRASKSPLKWLILTPETILIDNFKEDVRKHGYDDIFDKIEDVICYASLHKWEGRSINIGADEAHHSGTLLKVDLLKSIQSDQRIFISATIDTGIKNSLQEVCKWDYYKLSVEEAISRRMLPEPEIFLIYEDLDNTERTFPFKSKKKVVMLTGYEYYQKLEAKTEYWKNRYQKNFQEYEKKYWLFAALNCKRFCAEYKMRKLQKLLITLQEKRYICFVSSIAQTKKLGEKYAVHSKNADSQLLIDNFNSFKSNRLFCVNMLQEGANLSSCENGILLQIDAKEKSSIQKLGRILRHSEPKLFILLLRGTVDMKYWNNVKDIFPESYIKTLTL